MLSIEQAIEIDNARWKEFLNGNKPRYLSRKVFKILDGSQHFIGLMHICNPRINWDKYTSSKLIDKLHSLNFKIIQPFLDILEFGEVVDW
jgi:hypothetical protein